MSLYEKLQHVRSEEDVKDIYIKALGLKGYSKNLIDIQTKEIWFEAKDSATHSTYAMFTQLMHYVQQALNKGDEVPPFLAVIDTRKAAIMKSEDVLNKNGITVYPNPFINSLTFQADNEINQIFVFDMFGKVIVEKKVTLNKFSLPKTNWSEGIYLIRLTDNSGNNHVFKVLKTK